MYKSYIFFTCVLMFAVSCSNLAEEEMLKNTNQVSSKKELFALLNFLDSLNSDSLHVSKLELKNRSIPLSLNEFQLSLKGIKGSSKKCNNLRVFVLNDTTNSKSVLNKKSNCEYYSNLIDIIFQKGVYYIKEEQEGIRYSININQDNINKFNIPLENRIKEKIKMYQNKGTKFRISLEVWFLDLQMNNDELINTLNLHPINGSYFGTLSVRTKETGSIDYCIKEWQNNRPINKKHK